MSLSTPTTPVQFPRLRKWPSWKQLVHSSRVFSTLEQRVLQVAVVTLLISTSWTALSQAGASLVVQPTPGGTYTEGLVGQPQFINPVYASASATDTDLTRLVFAGLYRYDEQLQLQPDLATSLEKNAEGTSYTIILRTDAKWHNGEPVTAQDVVFTYQKITDAEVESPLAATFQGVVVEALDDKTVRFSLPQPYPAFLHTLTTGILPQHIWSTIPSKDWRTSDYNIRPIGNGDWEFSSLKRSSDGTITSYTLRHSQYADTPANIDKIVFKFFTSEEAALSALRARAVQGFAFGLGRFPSEQEEQNGITYTNLTIPATTAVFFNLGTSSVLDNSRVREALGLAIDRRTLVVDVLNSQAQPLLHALPKQIVGSAKTSSTPQYDPVAAENLLDRAGWERIGAIRKNSTDETLTVALTAVDREPDRSVARAIQQSWQAIGIDVPLTLIKPATAEVIQRTTLEPRAYQALLFTTVYGVNPDLYPYWHSSQRVHPGLNLAQVASQRIDDAVIALRRANTPETYSTALGTALDEIDAEQPAIFLYSPPLVYAQSDKIRGMMNTQIAVPADRFNNIHQWFADQSYRIERE